MKNLYSKTIALVAVFMTLFATSCEDILGEGINENPNSPTAVPVTVLLPAAEVFIVDATGGDFSRFTSVLTQQVEGVARQWVSINNYSNMIPATLNTTWNNMYENILVELIEIKTTSADNGFGTYEGVADVLLAYSLMLSADMWDNIPYTEAFQGVGNISPVFDSQASIYTEVNNLLTEGITLLTAGSDGGFPVGGEDVIYGGDLSLWIKAANGLLARMHLHQGNYAAALTAAGNSFDSPADNMAYTYPDATNSAQWFRFNRDRTGDIEFHGTMSAIMTGLNDTDRLAMFNPTFVTDHPYLIATYEQELISYRELKFIEAECLFRTGGTPAAIRDAYLAGIEASFAEVGVSDGYAAYVAQASVDPGVGNVTLDQIMTQKYIGLFTHPEVYNDWRRTNIPSLTPVTGANVPVRLPYGSDEHLFNENAPTEESVNIFTDRVGWNR